jgi:hypothetical protein
MIKENKIVNSDVRIKVALYIDPMDLHTINQFANDFGLTTSAAVRIIIREWKRGRDKKLSLEGKEGDDRK